MKWNVEKSKKEDCKSIAEFVTRTWNETYRGIVNDEFLDNLENTEEKRYINAINNFDEKSNMQYIIKKDNKIIAYLKLSKIKDDEYKEYIELQSLYVLQEYQKNGIGKELIQKAFNEAKKAGYKKMIIGCLEGNKSNGFYKKMGGKFIKKRKFKLPNQTLYENVYEYNLQIAKISSNYYENFTNKNRKLYMIIKYLK